ncbi:MAG: tetratricopeptide repeat protein [Ectothiorhodospiraceae bacterium]|nr:tetratricopeptide repeat protein [Ectothiorhodospiraceae bacterium]
MSLLMDALRRAEAARQAEAARTGIAPPSPEETQGFTLDPLEPGASSAAAPAGSDALESGRSGSGSGSFDLEDELELGREDPLLGLDDDGSGDRGRAGAGAGTGDHSLTGLGPLAMEPEVDDPSATMPSARAAQASVDDYFDGTRSMSLSMDSVRTALDDRTATGERASATASTDQRTVRAVFQAKRARRERSRTALLVLVPILVLLLVAFAGWVLWDVPEVRDLRASLFGQPAVVARQSPAPRPAPVAPARTPTPPPAAATATTTTTTAATGQTPPVTPPAAGTGAPTPPPAAESAPQAAGIAGAAGAAGVAAAGTAAATVATAASEAPSTARTASAAAPSRGEFNAVPSVDEVAPGARGRGQGPMVPPDMPLPEGLSQAIESAGLASSGGAGAGISITRRSRTARAPALAREGYEAFRAGDLATARSAYTRLLRREPRNRDAMLGLAAVAVGEGRPQEAAEIYARLLALDSRDPVAQAALISITDNLDPLAGESRVKELLRSYPDAAYLHFSLGNLMARQSRWAEAQQAYFDAHRLESENADYAYNLAVSLDRLSQPRAALQFYRRALDLAATGYVSFERGAVERRIQSITTAAR